MEWCAPCLQGCQLPCNNCFDVLTNMDLKSLQSEAWQAHKLVTCVLCYKIVALTSYYELVRFQIVETGLTNCREEESERHQLLSTSTLILIILF